MGEIENVIVIGGGPAGYTAALYAARADLRPLVIEGFPWGGQLKITSDVENYPGFPDGIMGPQMMEDSAVRPSVSVRGCHRPRDEGRPLRGPAGSQGWGGRRRTPGDRRGPLDGRERTWLGVSARGALRAAGSLLRDLRRRLLQGRPTIVVGGGDSAFEEAMFLESSLRQGHVVHRRASSAPRRSCSTGRAQRKIEFLTPYGRALPLRTSSSATAALVNTGDRRDRRRSRGAFIAIGHDPQSSLVRRQIDHDENGYLVTEARSTELTSRASSRPATVDHPIGRP